MPREYAEGLHKHSNTQVWPCVDLLHCMISANYGRSSCRICPTACSGSCCMTMRTATQGVPARSWR